MIKTWEFDFNQVPGKAFPDYEDQELVQRAFDFNLDVLTGLEARGFEGVFYSEHHFIATMSPCPNLLVALLAGKTKNLKIGVMGNVLAFHQPWRLSEELGMLDYITQGRLEVGVASGVPPEFAFVNIEQQDIRPMYEEILEFYEKSREDKFVSHEGKYFNYTDVPIMPRPRKETRRRHWKTIMSPRSAKVAAGLDYKICTGFQGCDTARVAFDAYRAEMDNLGQTVSSDDMALRRQVVLADEQSKAEALFGELAQASKARMDAAFADVYSRLHSTGLGASEGVKSSGVMDAAVVPDQKSLVDNLDKDGNVAKSVTDAMDAFVNADEFITGSPENVADQIVEQCRKTGAGNLMAYRPAAMDEEQILHNYDMWEKVNSILQKAEVELAA